MLTTALLAVALAVSPDVEHHAATNDATTATSSSLRFQCDHSKPDAAAIASARSNVSMGMLNELEPVPAFGAEGSWRLQFQAGGGFEPKRTENKFGFGGVGVSYFFIENLSIDLELNGFYFGQTGRDTGGVNLGLLIRWHFISEPTWSIYIDGGSGIMVSGHRVPHTGTRFNFASQAGVGFSIEVTPEMRLMGGVRWQHISNAGLASRNPGRDNVLAYAMISLPF